MIRKGKKTVDFVIKCTIIYLAAVLGSWIMITCGFITPWREKIHVNRMKTLFIHDIKFFKPLPENW